MVARAWDKIRRACGAVYTASSCTVRGRHFLERQRAGSSTRQNLRLQHAAPFLWLAWIQRADPATMVAYGWAQWASSMHTLFFNSEVLALGRPILVLASERRVNAESRSSHLPYPKKKKKVETKNCPCLPKLNRDPSYPARRRKVEIVIRPHEDKSRDWNDPSSAPCARNPPTTTHVHGIRPPPTLQPQHLLPPLACPYNLSPSSPLPQQRMKQLKHHEHVIATTPKNYYNNR
jgi:hypothetical protein